MFAAEDVLAGAAARVLSFRVGTDLAWAAGLACGGEIEVLVERVGEGGIPVAVLEGVLAAQAERRMCVLETRFGGAHRLIEAVGDASGEALRCWGGRRSFREGEVFYQAVPPRPRLLIVGAVHVAQALAPLAVGVGFDVTVADPRGALATAERFPGVVVSAEWPDEVLAGFGVDAETAIVALTHDAKLDDPTLAFAVRSAAFYVGALGSRRTQAARVERLRAGGASEAEVRRLRGPVGLAIGAVGAREIALSIMAEVVAVWRGGVLGDVRGW